MFTVFEGACSLTDDELRDRLNDRLSADEFFLIGLGRASVCLSVCDEYSLKWLVVEAGDAEIEMDELDESLIDDEVDEQRM